MVRDNPSHRMTGAEGGLLDIHALGSGVACIVGATLVNGVYAGIVWKRNVGNPAALDVIAKSRVS